MKLLSTKEVAKYLSEMTGKPMSVRQVQHEIFIGRIIAKKIGHSYVVEERHLKHYVRRPPGKMPNQ